MNARVRLLFPLVQAIVILAFAFALHDSGPLGRSLFGDLDATEAESSLNSFAWALAVVGILRLAGGLASWLAWEPRSPVTEGQAARRRRFGGHVTAVSRIVFALWRDALWPVLVFGALLAAPRIAGSVAGFLGAADANVVPENLQVLRDLAPWALWTLAPLAVARTAAAPFRRLHRVIRFPRARLLALGLAYVLLSDNGVLAAATGFQGSQLLAATVAAVGLSCLGSVLRLSAIAEQAADGEDETKPAGEAGYAELAAVIAMSAAVAALCWGIVASFPSLSAALLVNAATAQVGEATLEHLSILFDARFLIGGVVLALSVSTGVVAAMSSTQVASYQPIAKLVGFGATACLLWLLGARMAPLGHAYLLLGAAFATGLFAMAVAQLAVYAVGSRHRALAAVAGWLSESSARPFLVGASLALYGLFVRPLLYDVLGFAQLFEWLAVLAVAAIVLRRIPIALTRSMVSAPASPVDWSDWSRHTQTVRALPDERFESVLALQKRFVDSGEWSQVWSYLLKLMFRNGVSHEDAGQVFQPIRACFAAESARGPWIGRHSRSGRMRERALYETQRGAEAALSGRADEAGSIDEPTIRAASAGFVEENGEPDALAVSLAAAYWQSGAELDRAVELSFPIVTLLDERLRWYHAPWTRAYLRGQNRKRREDMVEGAIEHLFHDGSHERLPVAIPSRAATASARARGNGSAKGSTHLPAGLAVEILRENEGVYLVRTSAQARVYVAADELVRQPLLPKDSDNREELHERIPR